MALSRIFSPVLHFDDDRGNPLAGGWLCTYISNTDTPVATYKDPSGTLNDVEIELDGRGECEVWLDSSIVYKFVLWNADKTKWFWKKNYITAGVSGGSPSPSINFNVVGDESTIDVEERSVGDFKVYVVSVKQEIIDILNNKKTTQTPVPDPSASGAGLEFIDSVTQDANGVITPHKKTVQDGTTSQKGVVQLNNAIDSSSTTEAATPKAVKDAYDELNNKIVARAVFLSQAEWAVQSLLPGDPAKVYYVENGTGEDAYTVYVWKESTSTYEEVDESSIDLDGYWHDGPTTTGNGNVVTSITLGNDGVPQVEKGMSAEPAFSVLPISKGGTGKDNAKGALNALTSQMTHYDTQPNDDTLLVQKFGTPTDSNGALYTRPYSYLWAYIKSKISSVLGLSENGYTGNAATATSATNATTAAGYTNDGAIATALAGKYVKPSGGIPKTDLASGVQSSLGKADSALQAHQSVTDSDPTLSWGTRSKVGSVGSTDLHVTMPSNPASGKLDTSGDGSNVSVTPDGTSTGTDIGDSTTLKAWAQKFKNLVGSLKALAFKDKASYSDLSSGVQASLDKADSALQSHQSVTDNNPTLDWGATSKVGTVGSTDLRVTMPSNPASASQRKFFSIYANSTKIIKLFRVYKFTAGSSIGTTVELIGRAGGTAVRVVINIKASITADYIQFYDYAGDTSHYFTLYVAQDPDNSSKNLVYASINLYGSLYLNASDASAGDSDIDFSVFGDVMSGRISGDAAITLRNMQDASWINSGTFDAARIPTSLPNVSVGSAATATHLSANGVWNTWSSGSYNSSTPYALIGDVSLNISPNNNGAGQLLQLEFGTSDIAIIKLNFSTSGNSSVNTSKVKVLFSTWTPSDLANRLDVRYSKFDNDSKLAIRFYVKFNGNWQVFRLRQLDCQSGDNGFVNWVPISFYSGSDSTLNPVGTAATFEYLQVQYTPGSDVVSPTTPVYVDSNGQLQPCTPSSMSVGSATSATNVNLSKTTDTESGDSIRAGSGTAVTIGNAGNAKTWDGHALNIGSVSSSAGTISIV